MNSKRSKRNYKDTLFRMIFREPRALLSLYNAVNGTDYRNPEELHVVTLENAIYMNVKNDLAFVVDCRMSLYEQQSTVNPNLPLRDLIYVAKEYQGMVSNRSLYSSQLVKLPTPYFVVFYNGTMDQPERMEMKLSDSFQMQVEEPALELKVVQLNVRVGYNLNLMKKCPLLAQYAEYVGRVQKYALKMPLDNAVERAVSECVREGILSDFLRRNRAEAIAVSIFEYDEEKELALFREAEREEGREEALIALVCRKLRKGKSVETIAEELEEDIEKILPICKIAAESAPEYDSSQVYKAVKLVGYF